MPFKENIIFKGCWLIICGILTLGLMFLTSHELQRVAEGQLFLFSMPWEPSPSAVEMVDAKLSVIETKTAAILAVAVIGLVTGVTGPATVQRVRQGQLFSRAIIIMFGVAVAADMLSTVWFFHVQGVDFEFHPAIRLFGYAYGRTTGPIAGKLIQAAGVLYVSILLKESAGILIGLVSAAYTIAAIYNVSQTLSTMN